jgi:YD repeat-containing protein
MSRAKVGLTGAAATIAVLSYSALAQETTAYSYDGLGRLQASTIAGGTNSSRKTGTCFDAAGNRMRYDAAISTPGGVSDPNTSTDVRALSLG